MDLDDGCDARGLIADVDLVTFALAEQTPREIGLVRDDVVLRRALPGAEDGDRSLEVSTDQLDLGSDSHLGCVDLTRVEDL